MGSSAPGRGPRSRFVALSFRLPRARSICSSLICGADGGPGAKGGGWDRLIQPLDQGTFDNYAFLREVVKRGYTGPIGLQCYNVKLPPKEHLTRSIEAWREFQRRSRSE